MPSAKIVCKRQKNIAALISQRLSRTGFIIFCSYKKTLHIRQSNLFYARHPVIQKRRRKSFNVNELPSNTILYSVLSNAILYPLLQKVAFHAAKGHKPRAKRAPFGM